MEIDDTHYYSHEPNAYVWLARTSAQPRLELTVETAAEQGQVVSTTTLPS